MKRIMKDRIIIMKYKSFDLLQDLPNFIVSYWMEDSTSQERDNITVCIIFDTVCIIFLIN